MREHDVYILASNEQEGWGATVNEALEEGMTVLGTYEAGASAALLPQGQLFHAGDWKALAKALDRIALGEVPFSRGVMPTAYTPEGAVVRLMEKIK